MTPLGLPPRVVQTAESTPDGLSWLARLPEVVAGLAQRWSLHFDAERGGADATCSFIAFVRRADGAPAVLKLGLPHFEAEQEPLGLAFWNGDPSVCVFDADDASGALLLERCEPGTPLSLRPEPEQDRVLAALLRRLWRVPPGSNPFRPLSEMLRYWARVARDRSQEWPDAGFASAGLERLVELGRPSAHDVVLATDLHAGNVLAAHRAPWLVIDPKPFFGDPAFDATQHLLNCTARLCADPAGTVSSFSDELGVPSERVRHWLFARLAAHTRRGKHTFGLSDRDAVMLGRKLENPGD